MTQAASIARIVHRPALALALLLALVSTVVMLPRPTGAPTATQVATA